MSDFINPSMQLSVSEDETPADMFPSAVWSQPITFGHVNCAIRPGGTFDENETAALPFLPIHQHSPGTFDNTNYQFQSAFPVDMTGFHFQQLNHPQYPMPNPIASPVPSVAFEDPTNLPQLNSNMFEIDNRPSQPAFFQDQIAWSSTPPLVYAQPTSFINPGPDMQGWASPYSQQVTDQVFPIEQSMQEPGMQHFGLTGHHDRGEVASPGNGRVTTKPHARNSPLGCTPSDSCNHPLDVLNTFQSESQATKSAAQNSQGFAQMSLPFQGSKFGSAELPTTPETRQSNTKASFKCDLGGCKDKFFKRRAELQRHQRSHEKPEHPCPAQNCKRVWEFSFHRLDKLRDHIISGHDGDALFDCPADGCPVQSLTKDLLGLHLRRCYHRHFRQSILGSISLYRKCPIPRCSFSRYIRPHTSLDILQDHLRDHDTKGRMKYISLLKERGYDARTVDIICPICPSNDRFRNHDTFYRHFLTAHYAGEDVSELMNQETLGYAQLYGALSRATMIPDDVRQHRRTLLSLWPAFEYYPVWEDLERFE